MADKLKSAAEFFQKYRLTAQEGSIDQGFYSGINDDFSDLAEEYRGLPAKDRYAVFVRLQSGGETDVLKFLYPFTKSGKGPAYISGDASHILGELKAKIKTGDVWSQRLAVQESIFHLGRLYDSAKRYAVSSEGDQLRLKTSLAYARSVSQAIHSGLRQVYDDSAAKIGHIASPLFDTDGDFDPFAPGEWDQAFDDLDLSPLQNNYKKDSDGDSIGDGVDTDPNNALSWTELAVGQSKTVGRLTVFREGERSFKLTASLPIAADPEGNAAEIEKKYFGPKFLDEMKRGILASFARTVMPGEYRFSLDLDFVTVSPSDGSILLGRQGERSDSHHWKTDILETKDWDVSVHEILHYLLDAPDYYHEGMIPGRDRTLSPGFAPLAKDHILNECRKSRITSTELMHRVLARLSTPSGPRGDEGIAEGHTFTRRLDIASPGGGMLYPAAEPGRDVESWKKMLQAPRLALGERNRIRFELACAYYKAGEDQKATAIFMDLVSENPDDRSLGEFVPRYLLSMGQQDKVREVKTLRFRMGSGKEAAYEYVALFSAEKDFFGMEAAAREGLARFPNDKKLFSDLKRSLIEAHRYEEALETLRSQLGHDPLNLDNRVDYLDLLLRTGRVKEAANCLEKLAHFYDYTVDNKMEWVSWSTLVDLTSYTLKKDKAGAPLKPFLAVPPAGNATLKKLYEELRKRVGNP